MSLEVIYVTRHGFRSNWVVDPVTGDYSATIRSPTGLPADPPLTAHGVDQAKELAAHLLKVQPPIDQVYSSPYYRCLQTVDPFIGLKVDQRDQLVASSTEAAGVFRPSVCTIRGEAGLSDWYGSAPFEHPTSAPLDRLKQLFPSLDENYRSVLQPPRKGESVAQLHGRVASCLQGIIDQCDREGLRAILLCCHAATLIAIGRVLTGAMPDDIETEDFGAFTCGLSVYRRKKPSHHTAQANDVHRGSLETRLVIPQAEDSAVGSGSRSRARKAQCGSVSENDASHTSSGNTPLLSSPRRDTLSERQVAWLGGRGIGGGFVCEINCDCSFLSGGEERGWRFSDESFIQQDGVKDDAGQDLGVVVPGRALLGRPSKSNPRL